MEKFPPNDDRLMKVIIATIVFLVFVLIILNFFDKPEEANRQTQVVPVSQSSQYETKVTPEQKRQGRERKRVRSRQQTFPEQFEPGATASGIKKRPILEKRIPGSQISLYSNGFEDGGSDGSIYPARGGGGGIFKEDVTVEAAFYPQYKPRVITYADGSKGIRFPTMEETPGGYDYSMQTPYVVFRNRFPVQSRLFLKWTVVLPQEYDNDIPAYYYDHRTLFRYYIEGAHGKELFSMRFINNREIGFYVNCNSGARSTDDYIACRRSENLYRPTIKLPQFPAGGRPHEVTLDIELVPGGHIQATFDGVKHEPIYLPSDFEQGNVMYIVSPGNALLSDNDLSLFSSIDSVEVYGYAGLLINEMSQPEYIKQDGPSYYFNGPAGGI